MAFCCHDRTGKDPFDTKTATDINFRSARDPDLVADREAPLAPTTAITVLCRLVAALAAPEYAALAVL